MTERTCEQCGAVLERQTYEVVDKARGRVRTMRETARKFAARRYCSNACWHKARSNKPLTKAMTRKRSQAMYPEVPPCEECGSTDRVQRHHHDYTKPDEIRFLCRTCHVEADKRDGTRPTRQEKTCPICGTTFTHYTHVRNKTCSPECLSELGRQNALKRWRPEAS